SINYAKRIQNAILPEAYFFEEHFAEFFILYRPRDIVSGDFYWATEHQGKAILAAADCTGHGIPGAFMSLIGNDLLNEIVNIQGVLEPDKILDHLRIRIRQVLHQDQNETQDGMDIAVLVWEKTKRPSSATIQLQFAAARHSLLLVQTEQIEQFKGDKLVIGGLNTRISNLPFNQQIISVQAGQSIYLFSDGIVDQFGGDEARKFSSPRLRDLLFKLRHVPLKDQKEIIDNTLDAWMGNEHQQTDDILLIGLKF
ncbi:MAG TPA: serine/threonine protein phosphatase, partial [Microscillaceae bacterium]|nr:serine/threonine protein phosphatase [Microscillaceae bacterium]